VLILRNHSYHYMLVLTTEKIIGGFNRNDKASKTWMYENFKGRVLNRVIELTYNSDFAKDLVTDVFLKLLEQGGRFQTVDSVRSFLDHATFRICQDFMRKQQTIEDHSPEIRDMYPLVNEDAMGVIEIKLSYRTFFFNLVNSLPPRSREILLLSIGSSLSNEEIAGKLGISEKSVANQKAEVIKKLKMEIEKLCSPKMALLFMTLLETLVNL
jgi:RNA polymerase sigma factor (sigma-70 family)